MISFELEEEERLLQETVHGFADAEVRARHREVEKTGVPDALRKKYHDLGLSVLDVPAELGGAGMSWAARVVTLEELGWGDPGIAIDLAYQAGVVAILELGDAAQQKRLLASLSSSPTFRATVAFSEPAAREGGGLSTRARRDGDFYVVDGEKTFVHGAAAADFIVVFAEVDAAKGWDGVGAFVVERGAKGLTVGDEIETTGLVGISKRGLKLDGVRVPAMNRLAGGADFGATTEQLFRKLQLKTAAVAVGTARAAYEYALRYSEERVAFGKPIGHFQAIAFALSDIATAVDAARWMVWRAAAALDHGQDSRVETPMAFAHALETAMFAADWSVQILGGHGYTIDHPPEKWMRDVKTLSLWSGTRELANSVVGDALVDAPSTLRDRLPVHDIQPVFT